MADTPETRLNKIQEALQAVGEIPEHIKKLPGFQNRIREMHSQLEDLKAKVGESQYDTLKAPASVALTKLLEEVEVQQKIIEVEEYIKSFSGEVLQSKGVKPLHDALNSILSQIKGNLALYESKKTEIQNLVDKIEPLAEQVEINITALNDVDTYLKDLKGDILTDNRFKNDLKSKIENELNTLRSNLGTPQYDQSKLKELMEQLYVLEAELNKLSERSSAFDKAKIEAKTYINSVSASDDLYEFFAIKKGDVEKLSDTLAQMMQEGDVTPEQILAFYSKFKASGTKTASEGDIQKWIEAIRNQDTTGMIKEGDVKGRMPAEMQNAIKGELLGPNTLTMLQTSAAQYNREYDAYLRGQDTGESLVSFGFTDNDFNWFWANCKDAAGVDISRQEARLVFLEGYTSFLGEVIKNAGDPKKAEGFWSSLFSYLGGVTGVSDWPLWGKLLAGGIGSVVTGLLIYGGIKGSGKLAGKGLLEGIKLSGKGAWKSLLFMKHQIWVNNNQFDSVYGTLSDEYKLYIDGNIKLIYARMALNPGETIPIGGDIYDALSYENGMKCISAIKAAVGSAEKQGKLKTFGPKSEVDQRYSGKIGLTRFVQNVARSPNGFWQGVIVTPNMWNYEANWGRKLKGLAGRTALFGASLALSNPLPLMLLPSVRRTVVGGAVRLFPSRFKGYPIDSTGSARMPLTDENRVDDGVRYVGRLLSTAPELARLTCSDAERKASVELLRKYVQDVPNTDPTGSYTETETLTLIENAIDGRGARLTRAELRIYTIQAIYLLKGESGLVSRDAVNNFITRVNQYRMSYDLAYMAHLDTLYERILRQDSGKYGAQELQLLISDIEGFYRGENIIVAGMNGQVLNLAESTILFNASAPRTSILPTEAHQIVHDVVAWLKTQPGTVTKEDFAREFNARLSGRALPPGITLYEHFSNEWEADTLRRGGVGDLLAKIADGSIATEAELNGAVTAVAQKPEYQSVPDARKQELIRILKDRLDEHNRASKRAIEGDTVFKNATSAEEAQDQLKALVNNPVHRCFVEATIPGSYSADTLTNTPKLHVEETKRYVETRWNTWIRTQIDGVKSEFDADNLLEDADIREKINKLMAKCSKDQKRELAEHFRQKLVQIAQESDETKVTRRDRRRALTLLSDSTLISEHLPAVGQELVQRVIDEQTKALKKLDDTDTKNEKETEIQKQADQLKADIDSDCLQDGIEDRIEKIIDACEGDVQKKKFGKELAYHFRDKLKLIAESQNPSLLASRKQALTLLKSKLITAYLSTTDNESLKKFISDQEKTLSLDALESKIKPLKDAITQSVLEESVENDLARVLSELDKDPDLLDKKRDLVRHYRDALKTVCDDASSTDDNRQEALTHLEGDTMASLPKPEIAELKKFIKAQKEKIMEKSVQDVITKIRNKPFEVEKEIKTLLSHADCSPDQKTRLVSAYQKQLQDIAADIKFEITQRRSALTALGSDMIRGNLGIVQQTELAQFIRNQTAAIDSLERIIQKRQDNARKLTKLLSDSLQGQDTPEKKKAALDALLSTRNLTLGQKNMVRQFFPEDGTGEVTSETVDACIHALIYTTQEAPGNDIAEAHVILHDNQALLTEINAQLSTLQIAEIQEQVNDTVHTKVGKK